MKLCYFSTHRQGAQGRPKQQNTLSLLLVFARILFMMRRLLKSKVFSSCRVFSSANGHKNVVSFLVLCLALAPAVGHYNLVSFLLLSFVCSLLLFPAPSSAALPSPVTAWPRETYHYAVKSIDFP